MREKLLEDGVPDKKIHVVKTFTDDYGDISINASEENYILYFGRFAYEKGIDLLVSAYHKSHLSKAGVKLVLVGGCKSDIRGVNSAILNELKESITFYDFLPNDQLESLIRACMFTVTPSRWYENSPNTILESHKFYKPVIATNVGSLPESVEHGVTGLLYEYENISDLCDSLKCLATNPGLRRKMNMEIKARATVNSKDAHYKTLLAVLDGKI